MTATVQADAAAVVEKVGAGLDVDQADSAQSIFGRQGAGDQRNAADKAGVEDAAEAGNAIRQ